MQNDYQLKEIYCTMESRQLLVVNKVINSINKLLPYPHSECIRMF
jgi:hypothetical protein